ncbi:MAG: hypothetical protein AAB870_05315 [Patescibacteria group bacterium]
MAISNDPDFSDVGTQPYSSSVLWTLTPELGSKTIYVKFFTQGGQPSPLLEGTITLVAPVVAEDVTTPPPSLPTPLTVVPPTPPATPLPPPSVPTEPSSEAPAPSPSPSTVVPSSTPLPPPACLEAPVITAAPVSEAQIDLECHGNSPAELLFVIERSTAGAPFVQIGSTPASLTKFVDASVSPDTAYSYRARAINEECESAYSNTATATTPASGFGDASGDQFTGAGDLGSSVGGGFGGASIDQATGADGLGGSLQFGDASAWGMTMVNGASTPYAGGQFCARRLTAISPCVKVAGSPVPVSQMSMSVGGSVYQLTYDVVKECFTGTIPIPPALGVYPMSLLTTYTDGVTTTVDTTISVRTTCQFFISATIAEDVIKNTVKEAELVSDRIGDIVNTAGGLVNEGIMQALAVAMTGSLLLFLPSYLTNIPNIVRYGAQRFGNIFSLFVEKKRRKRWGIVYDAFSKEPEPLAIVRLYDALTNKLIETQVTDQTGRFSFFTQPGAYMIKVTKSPFEFPSSVVKGHTDGQYANVYHGEKIVIKSDNDDMAMSIPIDSMKREHIKAGSFVDRFLNILEKVGPYVAVISFAITVFLILYNPSALNIVIFIINTILVLLQFLVVPRLRKPWGIVFDDATMKPLSLATISLFEAKSNKLMRSRLTDYRGRFNFLAPPGHYKIIATRPNFDFPSSNHKIHRYAHLYYGANIEVRKDNEVVRVNIPIHQRGVTPGSEGSKPVAR